MRVEIKQLQAGDESRLWIVILVNGGCVLGRGETVQAALDDMVKGTMDAYRYATGKVHPLIATATALISSPAIPYDDPGFVDRMALALHKVTTGGS